MFTDFEYADKRLSDFGWVAGHIGGNSGVTEIDIGCDITFNMVKNNHSSIHYVSSTSYDNVCTPPSWDIFKDPCGKNQEDMYATNDEVSALTKWLNRHGYRKFKPLYHSDNSDIHYYGSFNVKKKTINDRVIGLVLAFNSNAPYGFGEQITNEVDMDNNEVTVSGENIYIDDCAAVPPINIKLFGKGKQNMVPGNQLFDADNTVTKDATVTNGVITITLDSSDVYIAGSYNGTDALFGLTQGNYMVGCSDSNIRITLYYSADGAIKGIDSTASSNTVSADVSIIGVRVRSIDGTSLLGTSFTIMLNAGESLFDYELYVGGEQSPNMNYPQKVECLGENGSIVGKVLRKNFLPNNATSKTENGVSFTVNSDKSITIYGTPTAETYLYLVTTSDTRTLRKGKYVFTGGKDRTLITMYTPKWSEIAKSINNVETDIELLEDTEYFCYITVRKDVFYNTTIYPMIRLYGTDNTYESHNEDEQPFTALTPNGLRGIPLGQTIPDAIKNSSIHMSGVYWDKAEGQYYIADTENEDGKDVQRIKRIRVESLNSYDTNENYGALILSDNLQIPSARIPILSTHFRFAEGVKNDGIGFIYGNVLRLYYNTGSKEAFNEWLTQNEVYVDYILAEPIVTALTQEEIDQYNALVMNYPNTMIVNDEGAYMEVTYLQDYDNTFTICGESDEYTTLYPNISITCKRDGDLRIKNSLTGNVFEVLNCSEGETIYVNGEHKYINSDNENHKNTTLFNDFNYNYLNINISESDFDENIYETSMPCKIVIDYSPIRKVGV